MATKELQTINAVLKNKDKTVLYGHSVDDLFVAYRDVWESIKAYHQKYHTIPDLDVIQERFPDLEEVPVNGESQYYLESLKAEYVSNAMEKFLMGAGADLSPDTAPQVLAKLQEKLAGLNRFTNVARDLDIMDTDNAAKRYEETRELAEAMGGIPGIGLGIDFIDAALVRGLQGGDIMSIIGYPARGKSALGGALIPARIYSNGYKVLVVSAEMAAEEVQDRIYTVLGSGLFRNNELQLGDVDPDDFREFSEKVKTDGRIVCVDGNGINSSLTPNAIRAKIHQHRPDIVVIDYLQLMMDNRNTEDMTARMRNLSLELKQLAVSEDIPVIVISSATPDGSAISGPPNVEKTAWSRQLAYDSTVCIAIHRHDDTDIYEIVCAKNRYGPLFAGYLKWLMNEGRVEEMSSLV